MPVLSHFAFRRIVPALGAVGLLGLSVVSGSSDTGFAQPTLLRDATGAPTMSVQLQAGRADSGNFDFDIPGSGHYHGVIPIRSAAPPILLLQGTVNGTFYPEAGDQTPVSITIDGQVDTSHQSASINLWSGSQHYHLGTANGAQADATAAAQAAAAALSRDDWPTVYGLLSPTVLGTATQDQFVQAMTAQQGTGSVAIAASGAGHLSIVAGYTYFIQPVTVQVTKSGATSSYQSNLSMVLENGVWHLIGLDPTPS